MNKWVGGSVLPVLASAALAVGSLTASGSGALVSPPMQSIGALEFGADGASGTAYLSVMRGSEQYVMTNTRRGTMKFKIADIAAAYARDGRSRSATESSRRIAAVPTRRPGS